MDYFMYGNYISKKLEEENSEGKGSEGGKKKGKEKGKRERGSLDYGTDPSDQFGHFSQLVVLYMLVFLFSFLFFHIFFTVVQLQLSPFSPHYSPLPYPPPRCWCFLSCIEML